MFTVMLALEALTLVKTSGNLIMEFMWYLAHQEEFLVCTRTVVILCFDGIYVTKCIVSYLQ